jgi:hypothetical protein
MKIRFGLNLDGQRGWHVRDALGDATVGANGMLGILEPQLGLIGDPVPQSRRVVQYLECLKQCNHAKRFYHRSLDTDELGTAATLLNWRDQWHLYGWEGKVATGASGRLQDMADVEQVAYTKVAPSEGERLASVLQVMERRIPAIDAIILTEPLTNFPKRWQQVLSRLPTEYIPLGCSSDSAWRFLNTVQDRLVRAQAGETFMADDKLDYQADGSLVVVRAETRLLASRWFAEYLGQGIKDGVLVASDSAALLDDILAASGQARHGLSESSAYRPALQILPMALALLWAPLDFNVLISFLSHPVSPVRSYARRQLAGELASKPGIGGDDWENVLADIDKHYGVEAPVVREQISTWIDHPRFDQSAGVPVAEVLARAQKLVEFFRARLGEKDEAERASWNAGFSQTVAFVSSLEQLQQSGTDIIRPRQLQKLLAQATSRGSSNPKLVAEVGSLAVVDDPAALAETFDEVIWWQPVMPRTPDSYPWSISEQKQLAEAGVDLPDIAEKLESLAADWLKPILAAREKVVIILPPRDAEIHPAWQMISALVRDIPELPIEAVFAGEVHGVQEVIPAPHTPLPVAKRWWHLPKDTPIPRRQYDSFSSLESFLFNPYQWLLRYPAGLKASNILSVKDGSLLEGQLAHNLIERFFELPDPLKMSEDKVLAWFDATFPQVVSTEGAVLLMHGRQSDFESLRYRLRRALTSMLAQFKAADVVQVQSELELKGHYSGGEIKGYADLVLANRKGKHAIVDMKWWGTKKYTGKLVDNRHLQLGIYAELMRQQTGKWPDVAYYILAEAKLFAQHDDYFPEGFKVNKKIDESTPHLWERFKKSHAWRAELLKQGIIEVALEHIEETEHSVQPEDGLGAEYLNPAYNEYLTLSGWRQA